MLADENEMEADRVGAEEAVEIRSQQTRAFTDEYAGVEFVR